MARAWPPWPAPQRCPRSPEPPWSDGFGRENPGKIEGKLGKTWENVGETGGGLRKCWENWGKMIRLHQQKWLRMVNQRKPKPSMIGLPPEIP